MNIASSVFTGTIDINNLATETSSLVALMRNGIRITKRTLGTAALLDASTVLTTDWNPDLSAYSTTAQANALYKPIGYSPDLSGYVLTNDARLTDSRNASDVYDWAKAATKPAYTYSEIGGTPNAYTLPTATSSVLGGVKIGSNVTITAGVISVATPYTHPSTHPASIINQTSSNRFVTDAQIATWNSKSDIQLGTDHTTAAYGDHDHNGVYELALGNPSNSGYILSSTSSGTRSWITPASYTHPPKAWVDKTDLTELTVISNLTIDSLGHPSDWTTRSIPVTNDGILTLAVGANLGISTTPTFSANQSTNKTITISLTGTPWSGQYLPLTGGDITGNTSFTASHGISSIDVSTLNNDATSVYGFNVIGDITDNRKLLRVGEYEGTNGFTVDWRVSTARFIYGFNIGDINVGGNVNATSFIKNGGTSDQILLADGTTMLNTFVTMGTSSKYSSLDAGEFGNMSLTDDYIYICVLSGVAGSAKWKKIAMFESL